jgi:hydroxypyruvate isomerase
MGQFQLSICADTVFANLSFDQRARRIADAGFQVEFWYWMDRDIDALAALTDVRYCSFTGYTAGSLVNPEFLDQFIDGMRSSVEVARRLRCPSMFLSAGLITDTGRMKHPAAEHPATIWATAYKGLCEAARLAERHNLTYTLEHLNTKVDHPGFTFPRVEDIVRLLDAVGSPRIKLLFDIYHAQVEEGNLVDLIRKYKDYLGHIHIADVPGRHEPGTGEINYRKIAEALREVGYTGVVGLEAFPLHGDERAIESFKEFFA